MKEEEQQIGDCRGCNHIKHSTKTEGTPYGKAWCVKCKSWVHTEKVFCVCCRGKVAHKVHYLRCKRIYNKAIKENVAMIKMFEEKKITGVMFVPVKFDNGYYHIPIDALHRYATNGYTRDTMVELQDSITRVKGFKSN